MKNLRKITQYVQGILDSSIGPISVINAKDDSYVLVNDIGMSRLRTRLNGKNIGEVNYWDMHKIEQESEKHEFEKYKQQMQIGKKAVTYEHVSKYDGSVFEQTLYPVFSKKGKLSEIVILSKDISKRKKYEESRNRMLAVLSHDLRSPFNGILGITDLLYEEKPDDELIEMLRESCKNLYSLVGNTIDLFKGELTDFSSVSSVKLDEVVDEALGLNSYAISKKEISVNKNYEIENINVNFDLINIVYRNLISNAIKFSYPKGNIYLNGIEDTLGYKVSVKDEGVGMNEKQIDSLFCIDKQTKLGTMNENGSGIGMKLVHDSVIKYGGNIDIKSSLDNGTEISVYLPKNHIK